ncbi:MAG: hypothetical protein ABSG43_14435, partial [Solirubrobacteraceae bacterium]
MSAETITAPRRSAVDDIPRRRECTAAAGGSGASRSDWGGRPSRFSDYTGHSDGDTEATLSTSDNRVASAARRRPRVEIRDGAD